MAPPVKPATKSVTLYVGGDLDLLDEYEELQADAAAPRTLAGADTTRLDEVKAAIVAATMTFRFQALGRRRMQKLLDDHPPRKDKPRDQGLGFNEDTATDELIRKCLIDPELSDQAITDLLEDQLSDGQYEQLSRTVWTLNRRGVDIPFSLTGSTPRRNSAAG